MTINAPYNFAPLADSVYLPAWGDQVTHDIPFKDGFCGELNLTITAHSPILVGGVQERVLGRPGEVHFYQQPDGKYAIPGASLKGMLRAVLEIATFSRMRQVDDMRYGLRDIKGEYIKNVYPKTVVGWQKAGFMQMGSDSNVKITPCEFAKVRHEDIESWFGMAPRIFNKSKPGAASVAEKYATWALQKDKAGNPVSTQLRFDTVDANDRSNHQRATNLGAGVHTGQLMLTGQITDRSIATGKHHDFLFYNERVRANFAVRENDWQNFLFVHGDRDDDKDNGAWRGYWKARFYQGERVPVFYVPHSTGIHIGLALLIKLAGDFSVHDLINSHQTKHLDTTGGFDFSDILFGVTDNAKHGALKSRVSFLPAVAMDAPIPTAAQPTILNSPKPSYFPNYLEQEHSDGKLTSRSYSTYVNKDQPHQPVIRGWKRYPVHAENIAVQSLTPEQVIKTNVQTILHPLPAKTTFETCLNVHNLRPVELGAVLWALLWGSTNKETHHHSIGMGKPFGFGQITFKLDQMTLRVNDPNNQDCPTPSAQALVDEFVQHMKAIPELNGWDASPQLTNLLAMADPRIGDDKTKRQFKGDLKHMVLGESTNEFVNAKTSGKALPPYALGVTITQKAGKNATTSATSKKARRQNRQQP